MERKQRQREGPLDNTLWELKDARGISLNEIARRTGINSAYLSEMFNGHYSITKVSIEKRSRLYRVLNCTAKMIYTNKEIFQVAMGELKR